jgi:hypothetical protein
MSRRSRAIIAIDKKIRERCQRKSIMKWNCLRKELFTVRGWFMLTSRSRTTSEFEIWESWRGSPGPSIWVS